MSQYFHLFSWLKFHKSDRYPNIFLLAQTLFLTISIDLALLNTAHLFSPDVAFFQKQNWQKKFISCNCWLKSYQNKQMLFAIFKIHQVLIFFFLLHISVILFSLIFEWNLFLFYNAMVHFIYIIFYLP